MFIILVDKVRIFKTQRCHHLFHFFINLERSELHECVRQLNVIDVGLMTTRLEITGSISSVEGHVFLVQIKSLVVVRRKRNVSNMSRMNMSNILWIPSTRLVSFQLNQPRGIDRVHQ